MQKSINKLFLIIFLFLLSINASGQKSQFEKDIEKIYKMTSKTEPDPYKRPYIYKNEASLLKRINPVNLLFGGTLYIYQNVLSKHLSADCLYNPGCSDFSKQAIKEYGLLKGTLLSIDRVNRCNRIAAQDLRHYDTDITNHYPDPVSRYKNAFRHNVK